MTEAEARYRLRLAKVDEGDGAACECAGERRQDSEHQDGLGEVSADSGPNELQPGARSASVVRASWLGVVLTQHERCTSQDCTKSPTMPKGSGNRPADASRL